MTKLSEHFSIEEFIDSDKAKDLKIDNTLPPNLLRNAKRTAEGLESVRERLLGCSVKISSGYRCLELNRAIGSSDNSAHVQALAADFSSPKFGSPYSIAKMLSLDPTFNFDQLIYEGTWVHVSFDTRMRRELLTKPEGHGGHYVQGIKP